MSIRIAATIAVLAWLVTVPAAHTASEPNPCQKEREGATAKLSRVPETLRARVERAIDNASALVRFHRREDALAKLDALLVLLDGSRGARLRDDARKQLTGSLQTLRRCLAAIEPEPLATIAIHALNDSGDANGGAGTPAGAGVYIDVEGIRVGRTGSDGTVQAVVPSGTIRIQAVEYPSSIGAKEVRLSPGASPPVAIIMADSKEPSEPSELLLEEAPDDILRGDVASLTLAFVQDDDPVRIERIQMIEVSDSRGDAGEILDDLFTVSNGVIRATDVKAVHRRIATQTKIGRPVSLSASAIDTEGRSHYGVVRFHVGRFNLSVMLGAPPSNPALSVSNVPVRVSIVGSDVAVRRTSDASGRFEVEFVPDATVAFEAHTVVSGIHYYADATLTMCADRTVTLLMRNVKDLVAGTPGLIVQSATPACPPVPRR